VDAGVLLLLIAMILASDKDKNKRIKDRIKIKSNVKVVYCMDRSGRSILSFDCSLC